MSGWISIHRKLRDHFLWKEKREFSKLEAWIDILLEAQHDPEPQSILIKNTIIVCNRGQSIKSLDTWATRWNWSKSRVRRFLELLKSENMVRTENVKKTTRLTICNYDTYQTRQNEAETKPKRKRNASETMLTPDNNVNNVNNENKETEDAFFLEKESDKKEKKKIEKALISDFDEARVLFQGTKRGLVVEWENFKKKHKDYKKIVPLLKPAIEKQIVWRNQDGRYWKNFQTWINQSCWTEETTILATDGDDKSCANCGAAYVAGSHKYNVDPRTHKKIYKCVKCR